MLNLLKLALSLAFGAALGLGTTYMVIGHGLGFGAVHVGPWTVWPQAGSTDANPYVRAIIARTGEVPLGLAEGLMFVARSDQAGNALDGNCSYLISGPMPAARYWTLAATDLQGFLIDNPAKHYGFTSRDIVRDSEGGFTIVVGQEASAGNWLPLGKISRFLLVLRLYDTPLSAATSTLARTAMPSLARGRCA